jgi:hypothetical protein
MFFTQSLHTKMVTPICANDPRLQSWLGAACVWVLRQWYGVLDWSDTLY